MNAYTSGYSGNTNFGVAASIAANAQESSEINMGGMSLCGIMIPASFTGTAITFEAAPALGGTYVPVHSLIGGTVLTYTVAAGGYYAIDPKDFQGIGFLRIKSGSVETALRGLVCSLKGI